MIQFLIVCLSFISINLFSDFAHAKMSCVSLFQAEVKIQKSKLKQTNPILNWNKQGGKFPDLSNIKPQDLLVAQAEAFSEVRSSIAKIKTEKNPTFDNVIHPLEYADAKRKKMDGLWGALDSGFKDAEYKKVEKELLDQEDKFSNEVWMDQALFEKVNAVYLAREKLEPDQKRLVEDYIRSFENNGLNLTGESKKRFIEIKEELSKLESDFSSNILESTLAFEYLVTNKNELSGISENFIQSFAKKAKEQGKEGYVITLQPATYIEIMKNADNSELRKKIFVAKNTVAYKSGKTDNSGVILKISQLRKEKSEILGFKHFSEYALKNRMAHDVKTVRDLMNELIRVYKPVAIKEEAALKAFVKEKTGSDSLEVWDRTYWADKMLKEQYSFDESAVKEYLEYSGVQKAAFKVAEKLYGITFKERSDLPKYNEDTQVFEVRNQKGELISYYVVDPFARSGTKAGGAWASRLYPEYKLNGKRSIPISTNSTNFLKPENGQPLLLTVDEGVTLFHEFGHALHTILSEARYPSQSGTAVARDFVELPSQFFENFFYEKEVLQMFAYHYKTKEFIPEQYIQSLKKIGQFRSANAALRQVGLSLIDLAWHDGSALQMGRSIYQIEQAILRPVEIYPSTVETVTSTSFSHIFNGGYSSGYYSYKWAEILDADAFSIFKKEGLFNPSTANRFLKILQSGGSVDALELYKEFAGRDPSPDAMYERDGVTR